MHNTAKRSYQRQRHRGFWEWLGQTLRLVSVPKLSYYYYYTSQSLRATRTRQLSTDSYQRQRQSSKQKYKH
jgi:hypothetical protein